MDLSKKIILKFIKNKIEKFGFIYIENTYFDADGGLFYKIINDYCLTFGISKSRMMKNEITGRFYLSKTTCWSLLLPNFPHEAYLPMAFFLNDLERIQLLPSQYSKVGMKAGNWIINSEEDFNYFLNVIEISEPRFLQQENLISKIDNCLSLREHVKIIKTIGNHLNDETTRQNNIFDFLPLKIKDKTPLTWYKTSEIVLKKMKPKVINKDMVELYAIASWRQYNYPGLKELLD